VLTGGTGNLGPSVARAYLAQGAHLAAAVRDVAKGEQLRAGLADVAGDRDDPRLVVIAADAADRAAMDRLVEEVVRRWGRLDIVANLVGGYATSSAADGDLGAYRGAWDQKVATAVTAPAACLGPVRGRCHGRGVCVALVGALK